MTNLPTEDTTVTEVAAPEAIATPEALNAHEVAAAPEATAASEAAKTPSSRRKKIFKSPKWLRKKSKETTPTKEETTPTIEETTPTTEEAPTNENTAENVNTTANEDTLVVTTHDTANDATTDATAAKDDSLVVTKHDTNNREGSANRAALFDAIKNNKDGSKFRGEKRADAASPSESDCVPLILKKTLQGSVILKDPKFELENESHWVVANQHRKKNEPRNTLKIEEPKMHQNVSISQSSNLLVQVDKKINNIVLEGCNDVNLIVQDVISSVEVIRCNKLQIQILGRLPSFVVDSSASITLYLNRNTLDVSMVTSKSSECNVMYPKEDDESDWHELPIPHQYMHTIDSKANSVTTAVSDLYR
eukprot:GHVO01032873.1.p1 GENE.GHVO01032873.1~~GHVO01032873.1.p1  ORF type:complete len:363 (-),score=69.92 GHVO01032873.1:98-1186(-)